MLKLLQVFVTALTVAAAALTVLFFGAEPASGALCAESAGCEGWWIFNDCYCTEFGGGCVGITVDGAGCSCDCGNDGADLCRCG